ncbi:DNA-binding LytR/AlgR family response regulator [Epilithonimonas hungarica]|uniref:LytR/AlgR family response regulator transcription factor n=1 Tax=Epilithonimonas hungarica TaxID=454006 RepID=UPI0027857F13|nr:LytTR family DNA-binding domain-containing protein [Epilithonimonas hungarica]MDP9957046.1 DNA-binding LytR/AlgR family response regulator [Epilithonimonas hungarica]
MTLLKNWKYHVFTITYLLSTIFFFLTFKKLIYTELYSKKHLSLYIFEVEGNYTKVFFRNEKAILNRSLNLIERKLPQEKYFRANRNTIFNINYIESIENWFSGNLMIKLPHDNQVEISRRQAVLFKEIYGI